MRLKIETEFKVKLDKEAKLKAENAAKAKRLAEEKNKREEKRRLIALELVLINLTQSIKYTLRYPFDIFRPRFSQPLRIITLSLEMFLPRTNYTTFA